MDNTDRAILFELQQDGRLTNQDLATKVGLTPAPCLRRVKKLENEKIITGYTVKVDHAAAGQGFEVIINVTTIATDLKTIESFESRISNLKEVVEFRRMFGIPGYMLRVRVSDMQEYEKWLLGSLLGDPAIAQVDSRISMKIIKSEF